MNEAQMKCDQTMYMYSKMCGEIISINQPLDNFESTKFVCTQHQSMVTIVQSHNLTHHKGFQVNVLNFIQAGKYL